MNVVANVSEFRMAQNDDDEFENDRNFKFQIEKKNEDKMYDRRIYWNL